MTIKTSMGQEDSAVSTTFETVRREEHGSFHDVFMDITALHFSDPWLMVNYLDRQQSGIP